MYLKKPRKQIFLVQVKHLASKFASYFDAFCNSAGWLKNNACDIIFRRRYICCLYKTTWERLRLSEITMMRPPRKSLLRASVLSRGTREEMAKSSRHFNSVPKNLRLSFTHAEIGTPLLACRSYFINYRHCYVKIPPLRHSSSVHLCVCICINFFPPTEEEEDKTASR